MCVVVLKSILVYLEGVVYCPVNFLMYVGFSWEVCSCNPCVPLTSAAILIQGFICPGWKWPAHREKNRMMTHQKNCTKKIVQEIQRNTNFFFFF